MKRSFSAFISIALVGFLSAITFGVERSGSNPGSITPTGAHQVDQFTGAFTYSYPIDILQGRNELQPRVTLIYNSQAANGWAGMGWTLGWGMIHRKTNRGIPTYNNNADVFTFNLEGTSSDLVPIGGGEYRAQIESSFFKFKMITPSEWNVWDKSGKQYQFIGLTPKGTEFADWELRKITDTSGNKIEFKSYFENTTVTPGTTQYAEIKYTEKSDGAYKNQIFFEMEDRPDIQTDWRNGVERRISKRLKRVLIHSNGIPFKKYEINYVLNESSFSFLSTIQLSSYDKDSSEWRIFPTSTTFHYGKAQANWFLAPDWNSSVTFVDQVTTENLRFKGVQVFDANGDGLTDIVQNFDNTVQTFLGKRVGGYDPSITYRSPVPFAERVTVDGNSNNDISVDNGVRLADVNGDGLVDILQAQDARGFDDTYTITKTWLNTGSGWQLSDQWKSPIAFIRRLDQRSSVDEGVRFADLNGDGLLDIVQYVWVWPSTEQKTILINTGNGWTSDTRWTIPTPISRIFERTTQDRGVRFVDVNGDGLTDMLQGHYHDNFIGPDEEFYQAWINTGSAWKDAPNWKPPLYFALWQNGLPVDWGYRLMDINGDGRIDIAGTQSNWLNSSNGWIRKDNWKPPLSLVASKKIVMFGLLPHSPPMDGVAELYIQGGYASKDNGLAVADFNGDGFPDFTQAIGGTGAISQTYVNSSLISNKVEKIKNELGGTITIQYGSHHQTSNPPVKPITVVIRAETSDEMGNRMPNYISYKNGLFDKSGPDREFLGFNEVIVQDGKANSTITTYLQKENAVNQINVFKGKIASKRTVNNIQQLMAGTFNTYSHSTPFTGVYFPFVSQSEQRLGTAGAISEFQYDNYGNMTQERFLGDSTGGDERSEITQFFYNTDNYLVGYPAQKQAFNASGNLASNTLFYYDGATNNTTPPTKGLLTRTDRYIDSLNYVSETKSYDSYGNITDEYDANWNKSLGTQGNRIKRTYDAVLNQYPVSVTQAVGSLNFVENYQYDPFNGLLLSQTDYNNQVTTNKYDVFSRLLQTVGPLDTDSNPTQKYEYTINTVPPHLIVTKSRILPGLATLDTYTFVDGIGRQRGVKSPSLNGEQIISGQVMFDTNGTPERTYLPVKVPFSAQWVPPSPSQPYITTYRDGLGRTIMEIQPDQKQTTMSYLNRTTNVTDANNHTTRTDTDAYGRVSAVFQPSVPTSTRYAYDALDNLTSITDSKNKITTITYDQLGRKKASIDPNAGSWNYSYDSNGNLIEQIDARGVKIAMKYDRINRITEKKLTADPQALTGHTINTVLASYVYDQYHSVDRAFSKGKLTTRTDLAGTHSYFHDALGRTTQETKSISGLSYTVKNEFDRMNRPTAIIYPNNETVKYDYGVTSHLSKVTNGDGSLVYASFPSYDAGGRPLEMQQNKGKAKTTYTYDSQRQWLKTQRLDVVTSSGPQTMQNLEYTYDSIGNITKIDDRLDSNRTQDFRYDDLDRLVWADGFYGIETYEYDILGNFQKKNGVAYKYTDPRHPDAVTETVAGGVPGMDPSTFLSSGFEPSEPIYSISGTVISSTGAPVANVPVLQSGSFEQSVLTDFQGKFLFQGIASGDANYTVQIASKGLTGSPLVQVFSPFVSNLFGINFSVYLDTNPIDVTKLRVPRTAIAVGAPSPIFNGGGFTGGIISEGGYGGNISTGTANYSNQSGYSPLPDILDLRSQTSASIILPPTATLKGIIGPSFVDGRYKKALKFNGTSDILILPNSTSVSAPNLTVMVWAKPTSWPSSGRLATLIGKSTDSSLGKLYDGFRLGLDSQGKAIFEIGAPGSSFKFTSSASVSKNEWHLIAATINGTESKIYIDGKLDLTILSTATIRPNAWPVSVGGTLSALRRVATTYGFTGIIDEPRLQNRIWTADEIKAVKQAFDNNATYAYDDNGNRTSKIILGSTWSYRFNAQGLISQVKQGSTVINSYTYDDNGGRVKRTTSGSTTIQLGKLYESRPGGIKVDNIYAGEKFIANIYQSSSNVSSYYYPHHDHLNSVAIVTQTNGDRVQESKYTPYGQTSEQFGTSPIRRKFTSQEEDSEVNIYNFGARFYDPGTGSFTSVDPAIFDTGSDQLFNPKNLNPYNYCYDNPLNRIDPDGKEPISIAVFGTGAIIGFGMDYYSAYKQSGMSFSDYYWSGQYSMTRTVGQMTLNASLTYVGGTIGASTLGVGAKALLSSGLFMGGYAAEQYGLGKPVSNAGLAFSAISGPLSVGLGRYADEVLKVGHRSFIGPVQISKPFEYYRTSFGVIATGRSKQNALAYELGAMALTVADNIANKHIQNQYTAYVNQNFDTYSPNLFNNDPLDLNYNDPYYDPYGDPAGDPWLD